MILLLDNFDSFTYNLVDYLNQLDLQVDVKRNDISIDSLKMNQYSGLVISPGPGIPSKAGNTLKVIGHFYDKIPILGICLGHQAIAEFFHGEISHAEKPMHGKISAINHDGDLLFHNIPPVFDVVRYHSLVCSRLPGTMKEIAKTKEGEVMAIRHLTYNTYGVQFHPEAVLSEYGLEILKNWKNINMLTD